MMFCTKHWPSIIALIAFLALSNRMLNTVPVNPKLSALVRSGGFANSNERPVASMPGPNPPDVQARVIGKMKRNKGRSCVKIERRAMPRAAVRITASMATPYRWILVNENMRIARLFMPAQWMSYERALDAAASVTTGPISSCGMRVNEMPSGF